MGPGRRRTTYHRIGDSTLTLSDWLPRENLKGTPSAIPVSYPSGTLWPHGEFSYGYAREKPQCKKWHEHPAQVSQKAEEDWTLGGVWGFLPLDLSDVGNSHKRVTRGAKGITGYGQQMVKAAGHLMQELWPHHRKTLGTITLPPMSQQARREVAEAWPEILRQLIQWQVRRLKRLGLPEAVVSVSEIQPARLAESGEAVLHLHQLWLNVPAKSGRWSFSPNVVRSFFDKLLSRTCPSYEGGFINVDTRPVEGVVAAYLAKYMSKGKQALAEAIEDWGEDIHPHTWWNMSKVCRDMVKSRVMKGKQVGKCLEECVDLMFEHGADGVFAFLRPIILELSGVECCVGWRGRFEPDFDANLRHVLQSFHMEGFTET